MTYPASVSSERQDSVEGKSVGIFYQVAAALFFLFVFYFLFLRIMNFEMRRDEQLYVPPARLLNDQALYADFFYNHPPASAWYFYGISKLTGSSDLLLSGRLGVFLAWILMAVAVGGVVYVLTRSAWATVCVGILSLVNELFLTQTGVGATNNFLPWPFAFLGLSLFLLALRNEQRRSLLVALAGFLLGLAVCFKLSAIAFIPAVALAAFLLPRSLALKDRIAKVAAPLLVGGLAGGAPILFISSGIRNSSWRTWCATIPVRIRNTGG
ncbi:glycosyltransferase family 39 protein (plasmid) [Ensifer adhaerens]